MVVMFQGLGKLDAQLNWQDQKFLQLSREERGTFESSLELTDRFVLSRLWVLGAYEGIRTLSQRFTARPDQVSNRLRERTARVKQEFARVRMPLAKLEAAGSHRNTDLSEALPALDKRHGISWKVAKRVFVPRGKLSDRLLSLLQAIARERKSAI